MINSTDINRQIALTIFDQLGGYYKLDAMIGIKNPVFLTSGVQFQIKCKGKANFVRFFLTSKDLYSVEFGNIKKIGYLQKSFFENICFENLKNLTQSETGLYLSL